MWMRSSTWWGKWNVLFFSATVTSTHQFYQRNLFDVDPRSDSPLVTIQLTSLNHDASRGVQITGHIPVFETLRLTRPTNIEL